MKSKKIIGVAVACVMLAGVTFTGCVSTNNEEDMRQVVATVDITKNEEFGKEFGEYASAVTERVFYKRDMLMSYYNGYYQYVEQYGAAQTYELIKNSLVTNAVVTQYATVALLKEKVEETKEVSLDTFKSKQTEVEKYEYLLGEDSEELKRARYQLTNSLNNVLDTAEEAYIKKDENDSYTGTDTRSTPSGIDTLKDDYVPDKFGVYTGYGKYTLENAGEAYEPLDNTSVVSRRKAYSRFVNSLEDSFLVTEEDKETTDIWKLSYVQESYASQLQSAIVEQYNEIFEKAQEEKINTKNSEGVYTYVQDKYAGDDDGQLTAQKKTNSDTNGFDTIMGNASDTSFVLYSPKTENTDNGTFGYVYNILLPFSKTQEKELGVIKNYLSEKTITDGEYFAERNKILKNIVTTDQRSAWFNGTTDYSFNAKDSELEYYGKSDGREYLFFENNLTKTDKYEELNKYIGKYSYNGTVKKNGDGSYTLSPNSLNIDGMLDEFSAYINYVLGKTGAVTVNKTANYYDTQAKDFYKTTDNGGDGKAIDYDKLIYAEGSVNFTDGRTSKDDMFVTSTERYMAMAAVNELQYAYTTDTGVLSQYIGYTVSAYETSYIAEFEYAAQKTLKKGAGNFCVCAGDYGWHLIYVTDTFKAEGGEAYNPQWTEDRIKEEGTFENRFYEWLKDSTLTRESSLKTEEILKIYNTDDAVKVYENVYKDLIG